MLRRPEVGGEQGAAWRGEGTAVRWLANSLANADTTAATETRVAWVLKTYPRYGGLILATR
eukprot:2673225-Pleurochrysis_carterae.AAC.1